MHSHQAGTFGGVSWCLLSIVIPMTVVNITVNITVVCEVYNRKPETVHSLSTPIRQHDVLSCDKCVSKGAAYSQCPICHLEHIFKLRI